MPFQKGHKGIKKGEKIETSGFMQEVPARPLPPVQTQAQADIPISEPKPKEEYVDPSKICFFGEYDIKKTIGENDTIETSFRAQYPIYYFPTQIEHMKEEIGKKERALADGKVKADKVPMYKATLDRERKEYERIVKSTPSFSGKERDLLYKVYEELGASIADSMPTDRELEKGADLHSESRKDLFPCIKLSPEAAAIAAKNGVRVDGNRKVTRIDATRVWKLAGFHVDRDNLTRNTEMLRPETREKSRQRHEEYERSVRGR